MTAPWRYEGRQRHSMWDFPDCTRCGAKRGKSCRTPSGKSRLPHRERYVAELTVEQVARAPTSDLVVWLMHTLRHGGGSIRKNREITGVNVQRVRAELDRRIPPSAE